MNHLDARKALARKLVLLAALGVIGGIAYWVLAETSILSRLSDISALRDWVTGMGVWGPVALIALMVTAILISPLPSAPVAVTAGAAYGHLWGTLYVIIGAELGALCAFAIARAVGYEVLHRWMGPRLSRGWLGSQNALTGLVFVSRLIPFISFDIVSYVAGLSVIRFWRFAVATLAGIVPASFLLAHFGGEMATGETRRIMLSVLALGLLTLLPVGYRLIQGRTTPSNRNPADRA
jgi:uncharacterized membrane protein YdjX (TVP38/TMEM64 family)